MAIQSAVLDFEHSANAMAAALAKAPPAITYRLHVSSQNGTVWTSDLRITARTADGTAKVRVLAGSEPEDLERPYLVPPTFNVLGTFETLGRWRTDGYDAGFFRQRSQYRFDQNATPPPGVDVVVFSVKDYRVRYAEPPRAGRPIHLALTPRESFDSDNTQRYHLSDLVIDPRTYLPIHAELSGADERDASIQYALVKGVPLVKVFHVSRKAYKVNQVTTYYRTRGVAHQTVERSRGAPYYCAADLAFDYGPN